MNTQIPTYDGKPQAVLEGGSQDSWATHNSVKWYEPIPSCVTRVNIPNVIGGMSKLELIAFSRDGFPKIVNPITRIYNSWFPKEHSLPREAANGIFYIISCLTCDGRVYADTKYLGKPADGFGGDRTALFLLRHNEKKHLAIRILDAFSPDPETRVL